MQRFRISFLLLILLSGSQAYAGGVQPISPLQDVLSGARSTFSEKIDALSIQEFNFLIKKYYYQIQYLNQKLEILKEVRGHFEKSVTKAEEKYDEGEEDISQSDITKLKLGLAGTLNDIFEIEADLAIARLSLADILKDETILEADLADPDITPVSFDFLDYPSWKNQAGEIPENNVVKLKKAFLKVVEAKKKMELARNNRKITRALLVSEVANYDFGIGDPGDLFEALIIYTRVLTGYYKSVYNFNLSVAKLDRDKVI